MMLTVQEYMEELPDAQGKGRTKLMVYRILPTQILQQAIDVVGARRIARIKWKSSIFTTKKAIELHQKGIQSLLMPLDSCKLDDPLLIQIGAA